MDNNVNSWPVSAYAIAEAEATINEGYADCVLLHPNHPTYTGSGRGVRPLLEFLNDRPESLYGVVLVDKVVGKAAAMLAVLGGVAAVHAVTASEAGLAYLAAHGIPASATHVVPYIQNRAGDGMCPLEASVQHEDDPELGLALLQATIQKLMAGDDDEPAAPAAAPTAPTPYLGQDIPKLGFGLMRLPMLDGKVDIEQTKQMVDAFMAAGFTYFDTAFGYINGQSEEAVRTALVDRYPRERFQLATKLPAWLGPKTADEAKQMFWTSLGRTGAGYFDFYLLHNLGNDRTNAFDEFGIWEFVQQQKARGLIKHVGFSFHDKAAVLDEILTAHPEMEFVQLQINYADWDNPAIESRKCYEVARRHGKPVIVMEPVKGGALANLPQPVADVFAAADTKMAPAGWALRFAASLEGLVTVLSGMSTLQQMQDNLATMRDFAPLSETEQGVVAKAQAALAALPNVPCTDCRYCMKGCPQGIAIPEVFKALNTELIYQNLAGAKASYGFACRVGAPASSCIACGQCEAVCPQHIDVIQRLQQAVQTLEG